jgi:arsenate reductase (thioredoxin)
MAEGLLRHDAGDRFEVFSAGTKPSHVRPEAIAAMRELGIDISDQRSKSADEFTGQQFDYILTVCDNAKESCPIFPGKTLTIHHNFEDPAALQGSREERLAAFRRVREGLREYLREFSRNPGSVNTETVIGYRCSESSGITSLRLRARYPPTSTAIGHKKRYAMSAAR